MRVSRILAILIIAAGHGIASPAAVADDSSRAVIEQAQALLWKENERALVLLEDAVARRPNDADLWVELTHAYRRVGRCDALASWALRTALARFPTEPRLLLQKALLRSTVGDFETLATIGKQPGWESRAKDFAELLRLGLSLPEDGVLGDPWYVGPEWWSRVLEEGRTARALEIVEEGLRRRPTDPDVRARRALTLALLGRHDEALREQEASGWRQVPGGRFLCIGDAWSVLGRPELAMRSFGGTVPEKGRPRMVYALLLARSGDMDRALGLLDRSREDESVLSLGLLLDAGLGRRAAEIESEVVKAVGMQPFGNHSWSVGADWGSLENPMARAIRWLGSRPKTERIPGPHDLRCSVEADWTPEARERSTLRRRLRNRQPPLEEHLAVLRRLDELRGPSPSSFRWYRAAEGRALAAAARTGEGLDVLVGLVFGPRDPSYPQDPRLDLAAEVGRIRSWSAWDALADADPMGFVELRRALARIQSVREDELLRSGKPAPDLKTEIAALASRGPGVLRLVLDAHPWNTVGVAGNRTALLEVLGRVGGPGEVPVLLLELEGIERQRADARDTIRATLDESAAAAIEKCLTRITGVAPTAESRAGRREVWASWWWTRAPEILRGK